MNPFTAKNQTQSVFGFHLKASVISTGRDEIHSARPLHQLIGSAFVFLQVTPFSDCHLRRQQTSKLSTISGTCFTELEDHF